MANIFDGDWRSSIVPDGDEEPDGVFHIEVNPRGNTLEPLSHHDNNPITGKVRSGSRFNAIVINEDGVRYKGSLVVEGANSIISGFQDLAPDGFRSDDAGESQETDSDRFGQEQEVWVATKP